MKLDFCRGSFPDEFFDVIGAEGRIPRKKDVGDDSVGVRRGVDVIQCVEEQFQEIPTL